MFYHHKSNLYILIIIITIFTTIITADQNKNNCNRRCGEQIVNYPFGFSDDCEIKLNCSINKELKIGELKVQEVNSDSIFISLPAKCNRSTSFIEPLFGKNFAPTWNNTFLVQKCNSNLSGCVIPPSIFIGTNINVEGCDDKTRSDNITCFTQSQRKRTRDREDVLTVDDWKINGCKFLFSSIAVDSSKIKEVPIQFQVIELGWWLEGTCGCSDDANCTKVHFDGDKQGFRCRCREGFVGDGFVNGIGCRRG
jgi:hypothetical protein